jgi:hypothetical protein
MAWSGGERRGAVRLAPVRYGKVWSGLVGHGALGCAVMRWVLVWLAMARLGTAINVPEKSSMYED